MKGSRCKGKPEKLEHTSVAAAIKLESKIWFSSTTQKNRLTYYSIKEKKEKSISEKKRNHGNAA